MKDALNNAGRDLRDHALVALELEPGVDAAHIGVFVSDRVVTLRGMVATLQQKWTAERAVRHLVQVRAVVNDLEIGCDATRRDTLIAEAATHALEWDHPVPDNAVTVTVRDGWVILTGTVEHQYDKAAAERAVQRLHGVTGVVNSLVVTPQVSADVTARRKKALSRVAAPVGS